MSTARNLSQWTTTSRNQDWEEVILLTNLVYQPLITWAIINSLSLLTSAVGNKQRGIRGNRERGSKEKTAAGWKTVVRKGGQERRVQTTRETYQVLLTGVRKSIKRREIKVKRGKNFISERVIGLKRDNEDSIERRKNGMREIELRLIT